MAEDSKQTSLIHHPYQPPMPFPSLTSGIHHASTVTFPSVSAMRSRTWLDKKTYTYGLHGTPTSFTLEERLASIDGGKYCLLAPSGLAAIGLINLALLKSGDHVLLPENVYNPNREFAEWLQADFGVSATYYDPMIGSGVADLIQTNTRLVWTEAPGSVSMEVPDLPAICQAAHAAGALVALDNTWSAGLALQGFELGVDIVMQALTKYQSGGSDVLMGAVIVRSRELHARLMSAHMRLGYGVGMDDAYLVLRSLPTMRARFNAHDASARKIAMWLKQQPEIARVLHPALPDCPGHEFWKRDFSGAGGLFSVLFDAAIAESATDRFVDSLRLFKIGYSWGGPNSLCIPYRIESMRDTWKHKGILVRFNIGLEDADDLIADISQALKTIHLPA